MSNVGSLRPEVKSLASKLKTAFATVGLRTVDLDTISKCASLAWQEGLSPETMADCWAAFSINRSIQNLDEHTFSRYRDYVIKDTSHSRRGIKRPSLPKETPPLRAPVTNNLSASGSSGTTEKVRPTYLDRKDAGMVVATYNPHNLHAAASRTTNNSPMCRVAYNFDTNVHESYRHMFTTLDDRALALNQHLQQLGHCMIDRYNLGSRRDDASHNAIPLESVGISRQVKVCCFGRICSAAHSGRINLSSLHLEGSRESSQGARIELDVRLLVSNRTSFSLFPGQVVAVEGMNTTGSKLMACRIWEGAAPKPLTSTVEDLMRYHHGDDFQRSQPLNVMVASGPYTTSDSLSYQPLSDLINIVKSNHPDVVILTGPFIYFGHSIVSSGLTVIQDEAGDDTLVPYDTFFANKVALLLEQLYEEHDLRTQFVLVPSLQDPTADSVFPQPPMSDRIPGGVVPNIPGADGHVIGSLGLHRVQSAGCHIDGFANAMYSLGAPIPEMPIHREPTFTRVHCVSNPCTFKINELVIGVTSTDVLFDICANEINANLAPGSRILRVSQHMLQQGSYYPLFPAHSGVNLDLKFMNKWSMPCQPDFLIVPSKLKPFAGTVLESTVVINPGHLTRHTSGGTYASIDVHPIDRKTLESVAEISTGFDHSVQKRTRVQIKKI